MKYTHKHQIKIDDHLRYGGKKVEYKVKNKAWTVLTVVADRSDDSKSPTHTSKMYKTEEKKEGRGGKERKEKHLSHIFLVFGII